MSSIDDLARGLRRRLVDDAARLEGPQVGQAGHRSLRDRVSALVQEQAAPLDPDQHELLVERVLSSAVGVGPLERLMQDPAVDEVMVNGPGSVWIEREGRVERTGIEFASVEELMNVIERILGPLGRRVDEASPLVDARLPDGSRVNCVIPPLSLDGPLLTIRRFRRQGFSLDDLVANSTLTPELGSFLGAAVDARANIVVSGGTGSGKTTLLNVLSSLVADGERIVTIEDAAELRLQQDHVLRLESRPASLDGEGEITIRRLVRNALRMRPDRIIVGEVRGAEALDMLQALNSGHDGSMTTVHSNSAADALRRIETLALMADVALPHAAVRQQLASALDLAVHLERNRDGARRVVELAEVVRFAGDVGVTSLFAAGDRTLREPGDELSRKLAVVS
jgi:pilus assembly protein CpaF